MPFVFRILALTTSITTLGFAADKDKSRFEPGPASSFAARQTNNKVTVAAQAYDTEDLARSAFGKANPYKHGVLPILIVVQNDSSQAIRLEDISVEYTGPNRDRVEATPAQDLRYLGGARKPNAQSGPIPAGVPRVGRKKDPFDSWELIGRAFAAKMLPPGESAHGFFYFQTGHRSGATVFVKGLREAASGKELLYFEIPLTGKDNPASPQPGAHFQEKGREGEPKLALQASAF